MFVCVSLGERGCGCVWLGVSVGGGGLGELRGGEGGISVSVCLSVCISLRLCLHLSEKSKLKHTLQ